MFADRILDEGIAIDLRAGLADVDLKGIFGEFPADTLFNRLLSYPLEPYEDLF